jgi:hypothetical protein
VPSLAELALFAKYHLVRRVVDHPAPEPDLGLVPLGYDPRAYADEIRAHGDAFTISTLAELTYRGEGYPVLEVRAERAGAPRVLVLAGVHGNEHAGLLAIPPLLARARVEGLAVDLTILTPVNPVGAAHLSRYEAEGYDVNRDFVRFDTPAARIVRDAYERLRPDFVVSLHEGPQDATFLFANRHVAPALAARLLAAMERGGTRLAERDYFGRRLSPAGYAPTGAMGAAVWWLWARTLGMMATITYSDFRGVPEIVLESSWRLADREARVRGHVDLVLALAHELGR